MTNVIYAPRLEYVSNSDDPEKELIYAIERVSEEEELMKLFGYLFNMNDNYRLLFIANGCIFEMDVIIKDKKVSILKGSFNDVKMYLVAKIAKKIGITFPENAFEYIQRRIGSILKGSIVIDYVNVKNEIETMSETMKTIKRTGYFSANTNALVTFRFNLKRFIENDIMKKEMESLIGIGMKLAYHIYDIPCETFTQHVYRLYIIYYLLEYKTLNEHIKSLCRLILLEYQEIDYEYYPEVLYEIAEWIYTTNFKGNYSIDYNLDMDIVD